MKIVASRVDATLVRLTCKPWLRSSYTIYAHWDGHEWSLSSNRKLSRAMLNAIDKLPFSARYKS